MPHVNGKTGDIIVRIVYDGPAEAGKTTSVRRLCSTLSLQRRGTLASPGSTTRRTEFFDWLDFSGGFIDGRRVRCQIVSVPGQAELLHRRRYLLQTADAVVYVADSRPERVEEDRRSLEITLRVLEKVGAVVPVGFVLQANKQDCPGALSPDAVAAQLAIPESVRCLGSIATEGDGIVECFVMAMRLATTRVREYVTAHELEEVPEEGLSPERLHAALSAGPSERTAVAPAPAGFPAQSENGVEEPAATGTPLAPESAPASAVEADRTDGPARDASRSAPVPEATEIAAGHIWPPVKGRVFLAMANAGLVERPQSVQCWAPEDAVELQTNNGWTLHSCPKWSFAGEPEGRNALLTQVRGQSSWTDILPEGRTLILARDGASWRLWMITPSLPSLGELLRDGIAREAREQVREVALAAQALTAQLRKLGGPGDELPGGAEGAALDKGRGVALGLAAMPRGSRSLSAHLAEIAQELCSEHCAAAPWVADLIADGTRGKPTRSSP